MKALVGMAVLGHKSVGLVFGILDAQGVAVDQVVDRLVLDQQVRAADGVGLGIVFLAEQFNVGIRVQAGGHAIAANEFFRFGKHAAGTRRGIIDAAVDAFFLKPFFFIQHVLLVFRQNQIEAAQHNQRQHDAAILRRAVRAAQFIGNIPNKADDVLVLGALHRGGG